MILRTSYFYQIRNFKPNMIPVSINLSDPKWYHNNKNKHHVYIDKRNIINGIRFEYMVVQQNIPPLCPCKEEDYDKCFFLKEYLKELNKLDFNYIMERLNWLAQYEQEELQFEDEPIIVFIVHEAWNNPCSERKPLQKYFKEHGIECKELEYPIN